MSQAKLTLRPPPNVEFVLGYPGIPSSGADRPQAAVKGTLELRVGPQGIKAKWVRIELRKVETLPGGGQLNTYYDFVGQSPVNLWQSSDDYGLLHTQDFPFYIRIPESIPPSLALERGAGVRYELVAMACLKGKKGFFRRTKAVTITTMSPIVIDKHELHSTWPIYCQPEIRNVTQDGVILTVERSNTCYGPGDRVSVFATVKSDTLHTVILRGFEFVLREHVVFRAGPQATGKKVAPQAKVSIVGEQKVPVNATLYGGTQHRAELACTIPQNHTSATLNSARHIDITYRLSIKAVMGTGSPLIMDLLVIVSNWPRNVSAEAIRRIGPAPTLSLGAQNHPSTAHAQARTIMSQTSAWTVGERNAQRPDHTRPYSTAPVNGYGPQNGNADEFGVVQTGGMNGLASVGSRDSGRPGTGHSATGVSQPDLSTNGRRPRSGSSMNGNNRFTIMNANEQDLQEIKAASSYSRVPNAASSANAWQSAEQEKQHLYDNAKTQVELAQRGHSPPSSQVYSLVFFVNVFYLFNLSQSTHTRMKYQDAGPILQADVMPPRGAASPWEAAEEEKVRLYTQAQMNAMKHQGYEAYSPPSTANAVPASPRHGHSASFNSLNGSATAHTMSPGAALYLQAMSQLNRPILSQPNSNANGSGASGSARNSPPVHAPIPKYYSADQEKEMLRRYDEAKAAVERRQAVEMANEGHEVPPYDLSRSSSTAFPQAMSPPMQVNDLPPALDGGESMPHLLEKERLRRHYEAQDAAAASGSSSAPEVPAYSPPVGGPSQSGASSSTNALSEKELLRRRYEAQDAAAFAGAVPPQPPPRSNSVSNSFQQPRSPPPLPPSYGSANRPLTAAEEKALLRAQYEAEDRGAGSSVAGLSASPPSFPTPDYDVPPPPPLAPRPPVEYIQETQQEDARLQAEIISITPSAPISRATSVAVAAPSSPPPVPENNFGLDFRPFSPFHLPFSSIEEMNAHSSSPPPPLPPKVPL
ncbi:hypothetical protein NEOLEDRAFT_1184596 [Neolentinus lepideus HHB14362 ss-1]|uniref:Arrestin C-terminal-like domain-containing protein n=1 Tax=Neolentinus lepideus HHB14362 ss-1 TaxID=1314782 RepID=A0A165MAA8_9AGAM|nr:hypothetical protein NEOLEDRAFT_1184596 [Neolentinus lepideus HHB14362 ss-1]